MRYQVIAKFRDKYTKEIYLPGKEIDLTDETRIVNLQKRKLIGVIEPEHVGGGYYELPDGTRVKGKQSAIETMNGGGVDVISGND